MDMDMDMDTDIINWPSPSTPVLQSMAFLSKAPAAYEQHMWNFVIIMANAIKTWKHCYRDAAADKDGYLSGYLSSDT